VLEHARAIGARLESAQADLRSLTAGGLDPLRVGFLGRGLGALVPGICRRLDRDGADVALRITPGQDEELLELARLGEVDVTFVQLPVRGDDLQQVPILDDDYVLAVARGSGVAPPTLAQLASMPLIGFKTGRTCQITDYFRSNNLQPSWVVGSVDVETIYAFVAAGDGVAIVPRLATLTLGAGIDLVELTFGFPPRRIGVAWSPARNGSEPVQAFVEAAVAEAARFGGSRLAVAS
jgi:DNA-binding transcriptional LysR family regulator